MRVRVGTGAYACVRVTLLIAPNPSKPIFNLKRPLVFFASHAFCLRSQAVLFLKTAFLKKIKARVFLKIDPPHFDFKPRPAFAFKTRICIARIDF